MEWWQIVIPVVIGWLLGIGTIYLREKIAENSTRKRIAKILVAEINSNANHLKSIKAIKGSMPLGQMRDLKPISAPFQKSAFRALLDKVGVFDLAVIIKIRRYYELLEFMEHNQKLILESLNQPIGFRGEFAESYINAGSQAADIGNELLQILKTKGRVNNA